MSLPCAWTGQNITPLTLKGGLNAAAITAGTSVFAGQFIYAQNIHILGFTFSFSAFCTIPATPYISPLATVLVSFPSGPGSTYTTPTFSPVNLNNQAVTQELSAMFPPLSYAPASSPRPELLFGATTETVIFGDANYVAVPQGSPVSLYLRGMGNTAYDSLFATFTAYCLINP